MDNVTVKIEVDDEDESVSNFLTTNIITHDSMVTCGNCKKQMRYDEYDVEHRESHHYLCWLDGIEEKIDFTNTSKVQAILIENSDNGRAKSTFVCEWCDQKFLTTSGFARHLKKCKSNPILYENDEHQEDTQIDTSSISYADNSIVLCGRCEESMKYEEYKNKHRYKHYNLCWLNGEEKLDYSNENKITMLLRDVVPQLTKNSKKFYFICEWCDEKRKSLVGFVSHIKKCAEEQNPDVSDSLEAIEIDSKYHSDTPVTCGLCNSNMLYKEYIENHKANHYNLCWINKDEKVDLDDITMTQRLLRQSLPKNAARDKQIKFICEWCQAEKKSVLGFASHLKQCQSRPDKLNLMKDTESGDGSSKKPGLEITNSTMVTCGRCNQEMTYIEYCSKHCSKHYNLCWIVGEDKPDFENYEVVLAKLKQFIPFSVVRSRSVKLTCEDCKSVKKSIAGFASHVIFCNKNTNDIHLLLIRCENCGHKIKPASLLSHKLKNCKGVMSKVEYSNDNDRSNCSENSGTFYKLRRKRRPPNILSFHPDTKYVTEYYDFMCRLCDFRTLSANDIIKHILAIHDIDLNDTTSTINSEDYISRKYHDVLQNLYLMPLLNYYNFFKKRFWKAISHEDFKCDIKLLNSEEAFRYLPSVQQSCKIFNSNDEQICVDLFKSAHINGNYWLFTGGPNWALSWCPVPKEVETQYLAISCHPKPDLQHKEMQIYKYPSLLQLWKFNSLSNTDYESVSDMPNMSYGLAHDFGAVWDMAWCPSGAYEPNNKIGLLALSTSCGDCPIFAMPCTDENSEMFYIYKAKPIVARNFECEWIEVGVQCTKVCWPAIEPFKTVICGYSNGIVSVFNINFKSIFLNDEILYPSHTFRASRCSITGLSMNYFNSLILCTTATDGNVTLWDLKSTENPIFQKKCYSPSDCTWLQQCYTLVYCSKGVNPLFQKVRTINFSNCSDDFEGYDPELYILKSVMDSSKTIINDSSIENNVCNDDDNCDNIVRKKPKIKAKKTTLNDSNINSDDESLKSVESGTSSSDEDKSYFVPKSGEVYKSIDEEDVYGPTFFQRSTHWSVSTSNWMNVLATGDEGGVIYAKLFLPETNHIRKGNCTTLQLMVRKLLSNDTSKPDVSNCCRFEETIQEFGLEFKSVLFDENIMSSQDDTMPLLRYPLNNITKVSWNQNFSSFRWLAIGSQSGFTLVSPSQAISDNCIETFYKIISTDLNKES